MHIGILTLLFHTGGCLLPDFLELGFPVQPGLLRLTPPPRLLQLQLIFLSEFLLPEELLVLLLQPLLVLLLLVLQLLGIRLSLKLCLVSGGFPFPVVLVVDSLPLLLRLHVCPLLDRLCTGRRQLFHLFLQFLLLGGFLHLGDLERLAGIGRTVQLLQSLGAALKRRGVKSASDIIPFLVPLSSRHPAGRSGHWGSSAARRRLAAT
mmetsp:Transcript_12447/g.36144  ORF Transcript_12447/g.36144 Transcript_12447/m.36144 type:complete len:206 (+) Transcript_12447:697-1314(+)